MNHETCDQPRVDWRDARRVRPSGNRTGYTFLELLISLAILLVAIGVVAPAYHQRFKKNRFRDASAQVESFFVLGRAESQRSAELIELMWDESNQRLIQRVFNLETEPDLRDASDAWGSSDDTSILESSSTTSVSNESREPDEVLVLPDGVRVVFRLPTDTDDMMSPEFASDDLDAPSDALQFPDATGWSQTANAMGPPPVRLAVFLTDGSVLAFRQFWLTDDDGRRARYRINTWTGLLDPITIEMTDVDDEHDDEQDALEPAESRGPLER